MRPKKIMFLLYIMVELRAFCGYKITIYNSACNAISHDKRFVLLVYFIITIFSITGSGFGGLEAACWPLVPEFAGSNPAEAIGFFGRKNPQHAFLRRGSKAACPMSCLTACKRTQK
jgi:hypothetical protein